MKPNLAIVILAAGGSRRFGTSKQLALVNGQHLIQYSIEQATSLQNVDTHLVLGANYSAILPVAKDYPLNVLHNRDWQQGMSSSIILATRELQHQYQALLFLAADQIYITCEELTALHQKWLNHQHQIIAAEYQQTQGIPAIFPKQFFHQLLGLQGDKGAKSIIQQHLDLVISIPMASAEKDIDTRDELEEQQRANTNEN